MSKFKVGDKVKLNKLIGNFKYGRGGVNFKAIGKIIGITENNEYYVDFPICGCWHGREKELVLVKAKYTYEDLKKSPVGTKITFENGKVFFRVKEKEGIDDFTDDTNKIVYDLKTFKDNWSDGVHGKIIKIEEPTYKTVYEAEKKILDEEEKKYLSAVIRPFKNRIKTITKRKRVIGGKSYIRIYLKNDDTSCLPDFDTNTMYKGMKEDKEYTLKELGL